MTPFLREGYFCIPASLDFFLNTGSDIAVFLVYIIHMLFWAELYERMRTNDISSPLLTKKRSPALRQLRGAFFALYAILAIAFLAMFIIVFLRLKEGEDCHAQAPSREATYFAYYMLAGMYAMTLPTTIGFLIYWYMQGFITPTTTTTTLSLSYSMFANMHPCM